MPTRKKADAAPAPLPGTEAAPGVTNLSIAQTMQDIAALLELKGENRFKIQAYERAADTLINLPEDIRQVWREGRLADIPNVGVAIAGKIAELLTTGQLQFYERLKAEIPAGLIEVVAIPELGPKKAMALYHALGITSIAELEAALEDGRVTSVPGFGAKTAERMLEGIVALRRRRAEERTPIGVARPLAEQIVRELRASGLPLDKLEVGGSLRRGKATIGDMDLLATSADPAAVVTFFTQLPIVQTVVTHGANKSTVRLRNGVQVDLMVQPPEHFGALLHHFTGSREHNIQMRDRAIKRHLKLSEYGFERPDGSLIRCPEEIDVFRTLDLPYIPPEIREGFGEIEAAERGTLPVLVTQADIKGDLHNHSTYSDGTTSIEVMARAAMARGYAYMAITDHSQSLTIAGGMSVDRIREQAAEVRALNERLAPFRILHGVELEIRTDGTLDYPDEVLAELDIVVASVHTGHRQETDRITERMLGAIRNPHVDIIAHPTGRILGRRESSALDVERVIAAAAVTGTALEINGSPERMDLDDVHVRQAVRAGVPLALSTDSHHPDGFANVVYGLLMARRGWATAADILTTWPLDRLLAWLVRRGA
jgi:DNA polymerase (family 10)